MTDSQPQQSWLTRRNLLKIGAAGAVGLGLSEYLRFGNPAARANSGTQVAFLESPYSSTPVPEGVLFGFDSDAFPSNRMNVTTTLNKAEAFIPEGQLNNVLLQDMEFYGSVQYVPGEAKPFKMWSASLFFSESADGKTWDPPSDMGIAGYDSETYDLLILTVLYDPDDSTNPYKMVYETQHRTFENIEVWAAYSSDGTNFTTVNGDPPAPIISGFLEPQGIMKKGGNFFLNGQRSTTPRAVHTFSSPDFLTWTDEGEGFNRDKDGVAPWQEQAHVGAALWDRQNVVVGIYDMWNEGPNGPDDPECPPPWGPEQTGCGVTIDLGLIVSTDGINFYEPVVDFKVQVAAEQLDSQGQPDTFPAPAITHGQGIINTDSETLLFFGPWHMADRGFRLATWDLDRLGQLRLAAAGDAVAESTLVEVTTGPASLYVNASGLAADATLRINLVDAAGAEIVGWKDAVLNADNGFAQLVSGATFAAELPTATPFRAQVNFEGASAENINLHAIYVRE